MKFDETFIESSLLLQRINALNTPEYTGLKLSEEANELGLVLLQKHLKPISTLDQKVIDEIGDTLIRIRLFLIKHPQFQEAVDQRIRQKLSKYEAYLEDGTYTKI